MKLDTTLFYDDAMDQLEITRQGLVSLKDDLHNKEIINTMFRAIHSLKGSADIYNLKEIVDLIHKIENLLDWIRNDQLPMSEEIRNLLFNAKDITETFIEQSCQNKQVDYDTLIEVYNLENKLKTQLVAKTQPTILIVDTDSKIRDFAQSTAKEAGYSITTAENCNSALETLKHNSFDLIFSDFTTIHPNKIEMLREMKQQNQFSAIPIVVLIEQKDEEINYQSKTLGVTAWLKKPFDKTSFLTAIEKLL